MAYRKGLDDSYEDEQHGSHHKKVGVLCGDRWTNQDPLRVVPKQAQRTTVRNGELLGRLKDTIPHTSQHFLLLTHDAQVCLVCFPLGRGRQT